MPQYRTLAVAAAIAIGALSACSADTAEPSRDAATTVPSVQAAAPVTWDDSKEVAITLQGRSVSASGAGVQVKGSTVTIATPGTYRLSGTLDDGHIVVASPADGIVRLVLAGVDIRSANTSPIAIMDADEVDLVLAEGSKNVLTDGAAYVFTDPGTDEPNAAVFSTADLTISGSGSLTVDGNFNDGISSKDGLTVVGGTITVDAVDDGIRGKDHVVVDGGSLTVTAGGDAVKADNAEEPGKGYVTVNAGTLKLVAGGDGVSAATEVLVADGVVDVTAGGGSGRTVAADASAKGLKGTALVSIKAGNISINSADDAVHSDQRVVIEGGKTVIATGDDGVHADGTLQVTGGSVDVTKSYEGFESPSLTFAGGDVRVVSADDGINAAGGIGAGAGARTAGNNTLTISGGRMVVDSGGDGLDVNGSATMTGGTVVVNGPSGRGNSAVDYDGTFNLSGGTLVAAGSSSMLRAPTASGSQGSLLRTFATQAAGTLVHIRSSDGQAVLTFAPTKVFQSILFSRSGGAPI
jgi:hypothetical protein